jgi:hypothetical protein
MKKSLFLAALLALALGACAMTPGAAPKVSVQQQAKVIAQACPSLGQTVNELQALNMPASAHADLAKAKALGVKVCEAATVVAGAKPGTANFNLADLQAVYSQGVPDLISAIKASPLTPQQQNTAIVSVMAAQIIVQGAINATQAAAAP